MSTYHDKLATPRATPQQADTLKAAIKDMLRDLPGLAVEPTGSQYRGTSNLESSDHDFIVSIPAQPGANAPERYNSWCELSSQVYAALRATLGQGSVELTRKCIGADILGAEVDIVPCLSRTIALGGCGVRAIELWTNDNTPERMVSFPEVHLQRLNKLDTATDGACRPQIQALKSAAKASGLVDIAPSYMIESAVMSAANKTGLGGDFNNDTLAVANHLYAALNDSAALKHGSGIGNLLGQNQNTQWNPDKANAYVKYLQDTWA